MSGCLPIALWCHRCLERRRNLQDRPLHLEIQSPVDHAPTGKPSRSTLVRGGLTPAETLPAVICQPLLLKYPNQNHCPEEPRRTCLLIIVRGYASAAPVGWALDWLDRIVQRRSEFPMRVSSFVLCLLRTSDAV
jgi:hypothetical protein